jgi:putative methyltransferase (TIGR04325 family)
VTARKFVRNVTPPLLVTGWRHARQRLRPGSSPQPEWEYVPEGWQRQHRDAGITGWNVTAVVEAYRAKLATFRSIVTGPGPIAVPTSASTRTTDSSVTEQNAILAFAYSVALAARARNSVSILDWGGGIGLYSLLARALLPADVTVEFHCKELPLLCSLGREAMPDVHFHEDDSCLDRSYDLVIASSSLQYTEDWEPLVARLAGAASRYLYLARVPVVLSSPSFVVLQRARQFGSGTEYLSWVLNRSELLECARRAGLTLVREFLMGYKPRIIGAPEQDETRGLLFGPTAVAHG